MSNSPILSVIVPTYNSERYIAKCLDSLISQTLADIEIICVDDGSTDGTSAVLQRYADRKNIKVISQPNAGPSVARNNGMQYSCGKYIAFVDSDDYVDADMYFELTGYAEQYELNFVMCNYINEYEDADFVLSDINLPPMQMIDKEMIRKRIFPDLMRDSCYSGPCNKIFKRSFIESLNVKMPENLRYGEDAVFQMELYDKLEHFFYCDKPFYHYVHRRNSLSSGEGNMLYTSLIPLYAIRCDYAKRWGIPKRVAAEYFCYRVMMDVMRQMKSASVLQWMYLLWHVSHNNTVAEALTLCNMSKHTAKIQLIFRICRIFSHFSKKEKFIKAEKLFYARLCYLSKIIVTFIENKISRFRLKNDNFTIICATCAGGIIYHKLGKRFLSPTVNLWFKEKDIIKLVLNLRHYMESPLRFVESDYPYPSAMCDDIQIFFNHAKTNEEAEELWNRRRTRVNYNNVWVISSDNGLEYKDIKAFADLPCCGKVVFSAKDYPEFDFVLPFSEYEKEGRSSVGTYMSHHSDILDRFIFEKYFDYVTWLNTGKIIRKKRIFF